MNDIKIRFNSTTLVQPASLHDDDTNHSELISERLELTPSDLRLLNLRHIQKGLLFHHKPPPDANFVPHLQDTLSRTLDILKPLAGRLVKIKNSDDETTCFHVDCNGAGALLVHAVTDGVTVADILDPVIVPEDIVYSMFFLNGVSNHEAAVSNLPLVAVQVTELVDGFFIACSVNHSVIDGTSFWKIFNIWSEISRDGSYNNVNDIVLSSDRRNFFLNLPIRVPFFRDGVHKETFSSSVVDLQQRMIHFSKKRIVELKAKANAEMGFANNEISSLQALMAHLWISVTRGRDLNPDEDVRYMVVLGLRSRLQPPLPEGYLGNAVQGMIVQCKVGELLDRGLGWAAAQIKEKISSLTAMEARKHLEDWVESPTLTDLMKLPPNSLLSGSSPRFNVYGNDFGWGRPVAVRSGPGNKIDGKLTPFPGAEEGTIDFEVCLSPATIKHLIEAMA
ncbi:uncharacterized acetyltransferase At3g50280-like [Humulus lupulus]|uniref:uncharacterized acetyltransferase At3g50280-like n=1 Tax=Humulus lupulus TaxID=3486 RepID=UPI002B4054F2|nr:uncharacterized acetyltransferase At3g50280-like [Humulus lupulus]